MGGRRPAVQPSVEPVAATDGLIHLAYAALVTNTGAERADIVSVVPVDPLADFSPTGRNFITDPQGRDVAGKVRLFARSPDDTVPVDGGTQPMVSFTARVPAGNAGLMFFDVTYTDPALIPRLLAHEITLASSTAGGAPSTGLTNPVPVGCKALAVLSSPLVGHGWLAANGCCTIAAYHRTNVLPWNGALRAFNQFAIDFVLLGQNNACCNGPPEVLTSWWDYNAPVLAAAAGVVVEAVDGVPDTQPVGTIPTNLPLVDLNGNHVVEDIGGGRYITYDHLKPGSVQVSTGARLRAGELIGRVGSSGQVTAPHLHFQVQDSPSPIDANGLPFVFATQVLEGRVPESKNVFENFVAGPVTIDRTHTGVVHNLMPARNGVFGYNLSQ
jgi:Peptidase family M23